MFALILAAAFSQAAAGQPAPAETANMKSVALLPPNGVEAPRPPHLLDRRTLDKEGLNTSSVPLLDAAGTAIVRLDVDSVGKLQGCSITDWAGSGKSDAAMQRLICDALRLKARFLPARDTAGRPVAGTLEIGVDPKLPGEPDLTNLSSVLVFDQIPPDAFKGVTRPAVLITVAVDADGKMANCRIRQSSGSPALDNATCAMIAQNGKFTPAHDPAGKAIKAEYTAGIGWGIPDATRPTKERLGGGTKASGDLASLFSPDDYPDEALLKNEQGEVSVGVSVTPDGRVARCEVLDSSGSASLDTATCKIIAEKARYVPAKDATGKAVPDFDETTVRWALPDTGRPFADGGQKLLLTVDKDGKVTSCRYIDPQMAKAVLDADCYGWSAGFPEKVPVESVAGRKVVIEHGFRVGGPEAAGDVGKRPGETLLDRGGAFLTIAADGTVTGCAAPGNGDVAMSDAGCSMLMKEHFEALPVSAADRSDRHGVEYLAIYVLAPASEPELRR